MPSDDSSPTGFTNAGNTNRRRRFSGRDSVEMTKCGTRTRWYASTFLASALSLQSISPSGTRAGVAHLHQLQQRRNVRLVRAVGMEGLGEIEDHVRREGLQLFDDAGHVVEDGQRFHFVPQALQARQHVGFGRLVFLFLEALREKTSRPRRVRGPRRTIPAPSR